MAEQHPVQTLRVTLENARLDVIEQLAKSPSPLTESDLQLLATIQTALSAVSAISRDSSNLAATATSDVACDAPACRLSATGQPKAAPGGCHHRRQSRHRLRNLPIANDPSR
jgi:hypothetical protein